MDELFKTNFDNQLERFGISNFSDLAVPLFDLDNISEENFAFPVIERENSFIVLEWENFPNPVDEVTDSSIGVKFNEWATANDFETLDINLGSNSIALLRDDLNLMEPSEVDLNVPTDGGEIISQNSTTETFSKIYAFGDSLSDPGNIFNVTKAAQPFDQFFGLDIPVTPESPPYFEGRFSNGSIWVDNLAKDLGLTIAPSTELSVFRPRIPFSFPLTLTLSGAEVSPFFNGATTTNSVNFAFGGAQTGEGGAGEFGDLIPGMLTQVEWFVNDHQQAEQLADPDALYIIWGGPNDYQTVPDADPEEVVDNLETSIESLFDLGGRNFLVPNIPDLGKTPNAQTPDRPVSPDELTEISEEHNLLLDETLDHLSGSLNDINLISLDVEDLFDDIIADPEEFGFTNVSEPCLESDPLSGEVPDPINSGVCDHPEEYLFWDLLHPTASAHEILSDFALEMLTSQSEFV